MSTHVTFHHGISPKRIGLCRPIEMSNYSSRVNNSSGPSSSASGNSRMWLRLTESLRVWIQNETVS